MNGTTVTYCNDILIEIHHFVSCCQASLQLKWCDVYPILRHQWGQEHVDRHLPSIPASRYAPRVCPTPETSLIFSRFFSTQQLTLEHNLWLTPSWSWKYLQRIIKLLILSASLLQRHPLFFSKKNLHIFAWGALRHQGAVPPKLASRVLACAKAIWNDFSFSCTGESKSSWNFEPKPARWSRWKKEVWVIFICSSWYEMF